MLNAVKLAMGITVAVYDAELQELIDAAFQDLSAFAGVTFNEENADALVRRAVISYCRANFRSPGDYERIKAAYDEQKAQLQTATGYGQTEEA